MGYNPSRRESKDRDPRHCVKEKMALVHLKKKGVVPAIST